MLCVTALNDILCSQLHVIITVHLIITGACDHHGVITDVSTSCTQNGIILVGDRSEAKTDVHVLSV